MSYQAFPIADFRTGLYTEKESWISPQDAFTELNMYRVSLGLHAYNPRALRSYEKAGFRHEGRVRKLLNKEGKRWDMLEMGILREEWMEQHGNKITN